MERDDAAGRKKGAWREFAVLSEKARNARKTVFQQKTASENRHLHHGIGITPERLRQKRGLDAGEFGWGVGGIVVAEFRVEAGSVVVDLDGAGVDVGAWTGCNGVGEAREGARDERVVAVEKHHVFPVRLLDATVAGHGAGARAGPFEDAEARVSHGVFFCDSESPVAGFLDIQEALPVRERLREQRCKALVQIGSDIAARDGNGEERRLAWMSPDVGICKIGIHCIHKVGDAVPLSRNTLERVGTEVLLPFL